MLRSDIAVELSPELDDMHFGPGEVDEGGFYAEANDQPLAVRFRAVQTALGAEAPPKLTQWLEDSYDLWLIPHRLSVIRRAGAAEVVSVGVEVEYLQPDPALRRTCSVVSLLPSFEYIVHGEVGGGVTAAGRFTAAGEAMPGVPSFKGGTPVTSAGQLELGLTSDLQVGFRFNATASTPRVSAIGVGASRCEWRLDKDREPLFGRDIETWSVLALPWDQTELRYRMRFYLITRAFFFPTRRQSDWTGPIICPLPRPKSDS